MALPRWSVPPQSSLHALTTTQDQWTSSSFNLSLYVFSNSSPFNLSIFVRLKTLPQILLHNLWQDHFCWDVVIITNLFILRKCGLLLTTYSWPIFTFTSELFIQGRIGFWEVSESGEGVCRCQTSLRAIKVASGTGPKIFHSDRMNTLRDCHTSDGPVNCTPSVHKPSHVTPREHLVEMVQ